MHFQAIKLMEPNIIKKVLYFLMNVTNIPVPHIPNDKLSQRRTPLSADWLERLVIT